MLEHDQIEKEVLKYGASRTTNRLMRDVICAGSVFCPGIETWLFYIAFDTDCEVTVSTEEKPRHSRRES